MYGVGEPLGCQEQVALLVYDGGSTERGQHQQQHPEKE